MDEPPQAGMGFGRRQGRVMERQTGLMFGSHEQGASLVLAKLEPLARIEVYTPEQVSKAIQFLAGSPLAADVLARLRRHQANQ